MKRLPSLFAIPALIIAVLPLSTTWAAPQRLPASLYPPGAHVTYKPTLSNHEMDCMWDFVCDGNVPLFHSLSQDSFNRTGGWGQFAGLHRQGRMVMAFELFASDYAPGVDGQRRPWAADAYADFRLGLQLHRYRPLHGAPALVSRGSSGKWLAEIERCADSDLVVMAAWIGNWETEAIVSFDHGSPAARATAISLLAAQVRRSVRP